MAANLPSRFPTQAPFVPWRWGWVLIVTIAGLALASGWLTAPLEDSGAGRAAARAPVGTAAVPPARSTDARAALPPEWPEDKLTGERAKAVLLDILVGVEERLRDVDAYTATFRKQERIRGALGPEQTLAMKVRHRPFAVYLKFLAPQQGKEVVYAEGHHDNKVIAHSTGVSRWLVPRLAVPPDHPLVLADSRHAITESGLANLATRLVAFRRKDLGDAEAITVLDRTADADGHDWLRSVHTHSTRTPDRPFARVEVLYDPATGFPMQISNYDWPVPEHPGALLLAERYTYEHLDVTADLTALDFDPANPKYSFHR